MKKVFNTLNFTFLTLFTVLITIFRFIQLKFLTDFDTACDNYKTYNLFGIDFSSQILTYFMYALILIYIIFLVSFMLLRKNNEFVLFYDIKNKSNNMINSILILFAALMVFCLILYVKDLNNIKTKNSATVVFSFISIILFAIYFVYLAYCFFSNKFDKKSYLNVILIFPVFWGVIRMFGVIFLTCFSLLTVREFLFNNFKIAFFTMFLFCLGKVFIAANSKSNERSLILFGNLSLLFGLNSLIPRIVVYFASLNNPTVFSSLTYDYNINVFRGTNFIILDFVILLFIAIILFRYMFIWRKEIKNLKVD